MRQKQNNGYKKPRTYVRGFSLFFVEEELFAFAKIAFFLGFFILFEIMAKDFFTVFLEIFLTVSFEWFSVGEAEFLAFFTAFFFVPVFLFVFLFSVAMEEATLFFWSAFFALAAFTTLAALCTFFLWSFFREVAGFASSHFFFGQPTAGFGIDAVDFAANHCGKNFFFRGTWDLNQSIFIENLNFADILTGEGSTFCNRTNNEVWRNAMFATDVDADFDSTIEIYSHGGEEE
jgi:hypothetical protein